MKVRLMQVSDSINAEEVLRKTAKRFGTVSHIILPTNLVGREVLVVVPKIKKAK